MIFSPPLFPPQTASCLFHVVIGKFSLPGSQAQNPQVSFGSSLFLTLVSGDLYTSLPLSPLHSEALIQIFWGIRAAEAVSAAVPQRLWGQGAWALADFMPVC